MRPAMRLVLILLIAALQIYAQGSFPPSGGSSGAPITIAGTNPISVTGSGCPAAGTGSCTISLVSPVPAIIFGTAADSVTLAPGPSGTIGLYQIAAAGTDASVTINMFPKGGGGSVHIGDPTSNAITNGATAGAALNISGDGNPLFPEIDIFAIPPDGVDPLIDFLAAAGTLQTPTALQSGSSTGEIQFCGYGSTGFHCGGDIDGIATENYTDTNFGTKLTFTVKTNGGGAQPVTTYDQDGSWSFPSTVKVGSITGSTQCIHASSTGVLSGAAADCLVSGGALGTPSSGTATNLTGLPHVISFILDGGGAVLTTGDTKVYPSVNFACTINRIDISADQSGSVTIDVWKAASGAIPTSANKISATAPLTLSSAQIAQNGSLTGWTTSVSANDVFGFNIASATTVTRVTGEIWCR